VDVLQRIQDKHPDVVVECIGVDLRLRGERYRHDHLVNFDQLPTRMARWDIGLAPIADNPFNLARSDIKLKEYAACRLPWLASDRGPYAELGEQHGGRVVADDGWFDAIDALVSDARARKQLTKAGKAWAQTQEIQHAVGIYETIFDDAIKRAREAPTAQPKAARKKARSRV
jgi:glycosyltransferase involved in cell wall biosynthesis